MDTVVRDPDPTDDPGARAAAFALQVASLTDAGPARDRNEDSCAHASDHATRALVVVADGVSSYAAGDTASQMAVSVTMRAYDEQPPTLKTETRLARAVQQANIEIHDLAMVVPELRGMATTVTAAAVIEGKLVVAHVGDSRLYLVRRGRALQLTKDHTAGKSVLTRSVGRDLIAAIDRISRPLEQDDVLVICTDGVYNVLPDRDIAEIAASHEPVAACQALLVAAIARNTSDNITAAVIRMLGPTPNAPTGIGMASRLRRLLGRPR
ncbi:MAG TPA: protein phosphatase 2C domain-containing protein [Polyangia bacterium]|nr:protein phosphatase 2C domain-containing protein [Polyangia bacterium]